MVHQLQAHGRNADEIGDSLLFDQPKRFTGIPFRHHHHGPADDEAVQHHRHLSRNVEKRHVDQGAFKGRRAILLGHDAEQDHQACRIGIDAGRHCAVRRKRALRLPCRARCEQDGRVVLGHDFGKRCVSVCAMEQRGQRSLQRLLDGQSRQMARPAHAFDPLRAGRIGNDQLRLDHVERMLHLVGLPPSVEQCRHAAGLGDRHVADDP